MANNPDEFDELLDRAARGLREVSVPAGPPADIVERVRLSGASVTASHSGSIVRTESSAETRSLSNRANTFPFAGAKLMRLRNLAAAAAAGLIIVLAAEWLSGQSSGNFVFADVQAEVGKTKSVQYTETFKQADPDGKPLPTLIGHVKILGNRLMRNEMDVQLSDDQNDGRSFLSPWGRQIEITDLAKKKKATLYPDVKGYMSMDWGGTFAGAYIPSPEKAKELEQKAAKAREEAKKNGQESKATGTFVAEAMDWDTATPAPQLDIYELIRHVPTDRARKLGEKTINGKRVVGFLVEQDQKYAGGSVKWQHTWWVDPTTKLPVQLEILWGDGETKGSRSEKVVSDIVFDAPLDPAQFSIDVPAGYTDLLPVLKKTAAERQALRNSPNFMITKQLTQVEHMKTKDGKTAPELVKRVMILDNYLKREEVAIRPAENSSSAPPAGIVPHVSVQNAKERKTIVLLPEKKEFLDPAQTPFTADYLELAEEQKHLAKRARTRNVYAAIDLPREKFTLLPLTTIDGQLAFGKHVEKKVQRGKYLDTREWTFWFDPAGQQMIRGEGKLRSTDPAVADVDYVLRDIVDYAPLDRALFGIEPPAGYTAFK